MGEADPAPPAHNTFLSVLVEQGVLGFAVFLRNAGCPRLIAQGHAAFPSAALDCLSRGLDRRRLQLDMGNAQTDLVFFGF